MANVFNKLGQEVLPKVFGKLAGVGLTDVMDIRGIASTQGTGGGVIKSASPIVYEAVPVVFSPTSTGEKYPRGEKLQSYQDYKVQFPSHCTTGERINIDPTKHRLHVRARVNPGDEPCKVFRILSIRDIQGNLFEADVVKED